MSRWKHRKSGGVYEMVETGRVQTDVPLGDMAEVVIYKGIDGRYWVRPVGEFDDRFVEVEDASSTE